MVAVPDARKPPVDSVKPTIVPSARQDTSESVPKASALEVDLRVARVEVFHTLAIDLAELVSDRSVDWPVLQRARAVNSCFTSLRRALVERIPDCVDEADRYIRPRMGESARLGGKAVWTEQFLDRFAPIRLPTSRSFIHNQSEIGPDRRLSDDPQSPLHHVRFKTTEMKMFRDGAIAYTVWTTFDDSPSDQQAGTDPSPASISNAIARLCAVDGLLAENFRAALADIIRTTEFRTAIRDSVSIDGRGLELLDPTVFTAPELKRRTKEGLRS